MTERTRSCRHALFQFLTGCIGLRLPVTAADIIQNTLKGLFQYTHAVSAIIGHAQLFAFGTIEDHIHGFSGEAADRCCQGEMILLRQCFKIHPKNGVSTGRIPAAGLNSTFKNGLTLIGNYKIFIRYQLKAKTGTMRTCTGGIVKGEHSGFQFRHADAAILAGIVLRETQFFLLVRQLNDYQTAGMGTGSLNGVCESAALTLSDYEAVNHQFDGVLFILFRFDFFAEIIKNTIHTDTGKTGLAGILKYFRVLTLFTTDNGRKYNKSGSFPQCLYPIHDLVNGLATDLFTALRTMGCTHSGPQQTQIVINLRYCAYSRTGVFRGSLLVNGNGRRQTVNGIHIRFIHLTQKLTGIGTETFHITALTLGINGIKSQGRFSGTGKPCKYHQFISGDGKIDIF